ncbi:MAG: diguanylate cyclase [Chloroflexi bacterium]|nr:diguanylate cyclase [Chloroflexota bacterium]
MRVEMASRRLTQASGGEALTAIGAPAIASARRLPIEPGRLDRERLVGLLEAALHLAEADGVEAVAERAVALARLIDEADGSQLWQRNSSGDRPRLLAGHPADEPVGEPPAGDPLEAVFSRGELVEVEQLATAPTGAADGYRAAGFASLLALPLDVDRDAAFALVLLRRQAGRFPEQDRLALPLLGQAVAAALRRERALIRLGRRLAQAEERQRELGEQLEASAQTHQQQLQQYAADFRRTYQESRQRLRQMEALYELNTLLGSTFDPNEVLDLTVDFIGRLVPHDGAAIYLCDDAGIPRRMASTVVGKVRELPSRVVAGRGPIGRGLRDDRFVQERSRQRGSAERGRWVCCLPMHSAGRSAGILVLLRDADSLDEDQQRVFELVGASAAMALQNARLVTTDPLTGLYNRRFFERALGVEIERARRTQRPLGLITVDIDHFKRFNETYGHPAADDVLRLVARTIERQLRRGDIVARVGGEEFSAILPEQNLEAVRVVAERVRQAVERAEPTIWEGQRLASVRVSVGGAATRQDLSASVLIGQADRALRQAKRQGRNRVCIAGAESFDELDREQGKRV